MPESEIENCIDGYEGEFASVFESAGRSVERARAELAELRAQAARAIDGEEMQRLWDCERIVRLEGVCTESAAVARMVYWKSDRVWRLFSADVQVIDEGPIVDGLPVLTPKARAAIEAAVKHV